LYIGLLSSDENLVPTVVIRKEKFTLKLQYFSNNAFMGTSNFLHDIVMSLALRHFVHLAVCIVVRFIVIGFSNKFTTNCNWLVTV